LLSQLGVAVANRMGHKEWDEPSELHSLTQRAFGLAVALGIVGGVLIVGIGALTPSVGAATAAIAAVGVVPNLLWQTAAGVPGRAGPNPAVELRPARFAAADRARHADPRRRARWRRARCTRRLDGRARADGPTRTRPDARHMEAARPRPTHRRGITGADPACAHDGSAPGHPAHRLPRRALRAGGDRRREGSRRVLDHGTGARA